MTMFYSGLVREYTRQRNSKSADDQKIQCPNTAKFATVSRRTDKKWTRNQLTVLRKSNKKWRKMCMDDTTQNDIQHRKRN